MTDDDRRAVFFFAFGLFIEMIGLNMSDPTPKIITILLSLGYVVVGVVMLLRASDKEQTDD